MLLPGKSAFQFSKRVHPEHSANGLPILYVGDRFHSLVQKDLQQFSPGSQLIHCSAIKCALLQSASTLFRCIILEANFGEDKLQNFIKPVRSSSPFNALTPIRILSLRSRPWATLLGQQHNDVITIPDPSP